MKRHHWLLVLGLIMIGVILFGILLVVTAPPAIAPTKSVPSDLDDATIRVAKSLYCPVCPGVPLDVCETQACQQWRALIREKLAAGQSPNQIQQYFVQEYGDRVLGAPRFEGLNLVVYVAPAFGILAGIIVLSIAARHWTSAQAASSSLAPSKEYLERVEKELDRAE